MSGGSIARRWRQLSGQDRWKGLLEPLDNDLRQYIIHYGDMAQATYDTFIMQKFSKYAGNSHYNMKDLFAKVGLGKKNPYPYETVKFLYATSKIDVPQSFIMSPEPPPPKDSMNAQSNWIGYIAVATDQAKEALGRRDIAVAWRGTIQPLEWIKDFDAPLVPASGILGEGNKAKVHRGFHSVYTSDNPDSQYSKTSARQQVFDGLKEVLKKYEKEDISLTVTGHSLGASLATLSAADIVANGLNKSGGQAKGCPVTAFVYACPRTGDPGFKELCDSMEDLRILRITNTPDIVPKVPPLIGGYKEVGENLEIDSRKSMFLKNPGGFVNTHSLQVYLHTIAGTQGKSPMFRLECERDIALVNKQLDALKEKYMVPGAWWCQAHGGMVQQEDGIWELMDHEEDD